jgi:transposase-like protein
MPTSRSLSPFTRPRWSEADAREVLAALERSGKPVSVFAAEHGLAAQRVYLWRRRLGASGELTRFQEVVVRPPPPSSRAPFEITLGSGTTLRVPSSIPMRSGGCAEPTAERPPLYGDAAGRRAERRRQSDGDGVGVLDRAGADSLPRLLDGGVTASLTRASTALSVPSEIRTPRTSQSRTTVLRRLTW